MIDYADFLVIATGASQPQVRTIADHVAFEMKKAGSAALHVEGLQDGRWVLMDFGDIFLHVFQPKVREYYEIERLWGMAPKVPTGLPDTRPAPEEEELPDAPFLLPDDRAAR